MNVAIIPARGGSKRIEKKNIRPFCGRPLIAYSIDAALETQLFEHVIVSTDCDEIANIAESIGACAPFRRPAELADDHSTTIPVIRHALDWVEQNLATVDLACCIYATAPMIRAEDIRRGHDELRRNAEAKFAFSVTSYAFPIFRALQIQAGRTSMFWPEHELTRSQDLPEAFHDAGQFYWGRPDAFRHHDGFFSANSIPIILPRHRVQDIDTPEDWQILNAMVAQGYWTAESYD